MQQWNITTLIVFYLFDWAETSFAALCFSYSNQFLSVLFLLKRFLSLKLSAFVWERLGVLPEYQLFVIFYLAYLWLKSLVQIFCFSYSNQFSPLLFYWSNSWTSNFRSYNHVFLRDFFQEWVVIAIHYFLFCSNMRGKVHTLIFFL